MIHGLFLFGGSVPFWGWFEGHLRETKTVAGGCLFYFETNPIWIVWVYGAGCLGRQQVLYASPVHPAAVGFLSWAGGGAFGAVLKGWILANGSDTGRSVYYDLHEVIETGEAREKQRKRERERKSDTDFTAEVLFGLGIVPYSISSKQYKCLLGGSGNVMVGMQTDLCAELGRPGWHLVPQRPCTFFFGRVPLLK